MIGLIGGIGAGKSFVAEAMARRGAQVLDADAIGHALLEQAPSRDLVLKRFGDRILDTATAVDGPARIDRRALGRLVFADPVAKRDLEAILHPRMRRTFERAIARAVRLGRARAMVLDAAILLEAGWNEFCDAVVFVDASREQRLARLSAQRGWGPDVLDARERSQWPLEQKRRQADHVLGNEANPEALEAAVDRLWQAILKPGRPAIVTKPAGAGGPSHTARNDPR